MKIKTFLKKISCITIIPIVALFALTGTGVASNDLPGKGITIKPARATWTSGFFLEALFSRALEDLGYTVKAPKKLSNPIFYQSLVNGDVDFWANGWFPMHLAQVPDNFHEKAKIAGTIVKQGALQGYLVSKDAVEKYNIKTIEDFKRPEVRKAFDANGDGKADLVACPPGWGCEKIISHHMKVYDLKDYINPIKAGYSVSMADAVARYNAGEPIFFYTWTPNWTVSKLVPGKDVLWIGVPEINPSKAQKGFPKEAFIQKGLNGAVTDPIKMGLTAADIDVVANKKFLKNNPAAARLFEVIKVPMADISKQNSRMYKGENKQEDIERHVTEWKSNHKDVWNGWLDKARKAAK